MNIMNINSTSLICSGPDMCSKIRWGTRFVITFYNLDLGFSSIGFCILIFGYRTLCKFIRKVKKQSHLTAVNFAPYVLMSPI